MKKGIWTAVTVGALVAGLILISIQCQLISIYNGKNKGVVVGPQGHSCGIELVGDFGPFCNSD